MGFELIKGDITEQEADVIVNASNGVGFMGGLIGKYIKCAGVAEAIHYATKGEVEKEAKHYLRKEGRKKKGEIFLTTAGSLKARYIIHAVTMNKPGQKANLETIDILLPLIIEYARKLEAKTIAIPYLGTGTGRLLQEDVHELYKKHFQEVEDIKIYVVVYDKEKC